ncbi:(deoxy)nucleoside triphosphate pyrophosphohydrolase [Arthrobacter sp. KK5.5]|uniref:(deoxy)nucleoside triphosphate pyrophosphohydrolase n=1 Tax=Arthrobacter sp. KK5.5 TaxID=3373084 RepID=UPI003EE7B2F9
MDDIRQIVGAAIVDSLDSPRRLLAARRTKPEALAGLWEFPGGKVEPGEECEAALLRELVEELGVGARLGRELLGPSEYGWPLNGAAAMRVWFAEITAGEPEPLEDHDALEWVELEPEAALRLAWIPADLPIVRALLREASLGGAVPPR